MTLTADQILALAPDAASAKAGSGQSAKAKWSGLGANAQALWGLCQGSGKEPYRAQIELSAPAFKCTCPSRKFPCKHGLGLYLLYAADGAAFGDSEAPVWVADWLGSRDQRTEKKAARQAEADAALTPEQLAAKAQSQQKRQQASVDKREGKVDSGLAMLDTWLADLAREGLAGLRARPSQDWDAMAARLVDSQAPGLAARVRRAGLLVYGSSAPGWELAVARELGQLALLGQGHGRLASLPAPLRHDVRAAIGWVTSVDDVMAEAGLADLWQVCGNHTRDDERISTRACYLRGERSGRWAVLLQFAAGGQTLQPALQPGARYQGSLHFYPGAWPLRAVFGDDMARVDAPQPASASASASASSYADLLQGYAQALALQPFIEHYPLLLHGVVPQQDTDVQAAQALRLTLRAADDTALPVDSRFRHGWHLLALAGGAPVTVFGLWNGDSLLPLETLVGARQYALDGDHLT